MSSKKSRLDLLVRVRYLNPIPAPPFPPKLFNLPTNVHRLGEPSYLNHLASSTPLPMLVDSEMGMPLVLNAFDKIWQGDDNALNPVIDPTFAHDPEDAILLAPGKPKTEASGDAKTASQTTEVSWMRSSNLFTRRGGAKRREAMKSTEAEAEVDASLAAQIMTIEKSFNELADSSVENMRHPDPKKAHLRAVETYDILPDSDAWANPYYLIKFPERPGPAGSNVSASSSRLVRSVMRPIRDDDQQFMEYYLPTEDDVGKVDDVFANPLDENQCSEVRTLLEENPDDAPDQFQHAVYERIRRYEVFAQDIPKKEVLITIDERPVKRRRGAYFKEISMRTSLRKTLAAENSADQWDGIRVAGRQLFDEELKTRTTAAEVAADPAWVDEQLRQARGTNDADRLGEGMEEE